LNTAGGIDNDLPAKIPGSQERQDLEGARGLFA
jgi:hypothetical protein